MTDIKKQIDRFNRYFKESDLLYHKAAVSFGLSDTAFWLLYALNEADKPCSQNDLCGEWSFSKQTVNSAVTSLIKKGYICLKNIPGNGKKKFIFFTDEGKNFLENTIKPICKAEEKVFEKMSAEEREFLLNLMGRQLEFAKDEINFIIDEYLKMEFKKWQK